MTQSNTAILSRETEENLVRNGESGYVMSTSSAGVVNPTDPCLVRETSSSDTAAVVSPTDASMVRGVASSDSFSEENRANTRRQQEYEEHYTKPLLRLVAETELEYGFTTELDIYIQDRLRENASVTREWLNRVFIKYYGDVSVATGILRTIAHFPYADMAPQGPTMAVAALSHDNVEAREAGVRAFENWGSRESLDMLRHIRHPERWLQEYVTRVIHDLDEELPADAVARKED